MDSCWGDVTKSSDHTCQLYFLWHGRGFVLFILATPVRILHIQITFELIFRLIYARLPINWKTLIGYTVYFSVETLSMFAIVFSILPTICFAIGSYLLLNAVIKVNTNDFHILCGKISTGSNDEMKKIFCNMVEDMSEIKELSFTFNIYVWTKQFWFMFLCLCFIYSEWSKCLPIFFKL